MIVRTLRKLVKLLSCTSKSSKRRLPTEAQLQYLNRLVEINNTYRAMPRLLEDWNHSYSKGKWDRRRASLLIVKLQEENLEKAQEFKHAIGQQRDRSSGRTIYPSDFSTYGFCQNAFYLTYRGFASKNLYELDQGRMYHGEFGRPKTKANKNTELLKERLGHLDHIVWFKQGEDKAFHDEKLQVSGLPDGLVRPRKQKLSVVELKTRREFPENGPYKGDILQACAYIRLGQASHQITPGDMSSTAYIIYIHKKLKTRRLYEINFDHFESDFYEALNSMRKTDFRKDIIHSESNRNKCPSCGYRALCKKQVAQL